jgi:hypothetical protein
MGAPKGFQPKIVGDRSCAMVLARLLQVFDTVLLPFGEDQRYDLVIDTGENFLRVQCKTGRLRAGAIRFHACSSTYHHPHPRTAFYRQDYRGTADLFGVYCPETDGVYLVPVEEIGRNTGCLRVESTKNNQVRGIRWAQDYEVKAGLAQWQHKAPARRRRRPGSDGRLFKTGT